MIKESAFVPAKGAQNRHVQTILPTFIPTRNAPHASHRERIPLPDGDFVDADWFGPPQSPIIIILHGLASNVRSGYIQNMLFKFSQVGWRSLLLYYRGCSDEVNLLDKSYHAGDTLGLDTLVNLLRKREPQTPIAALGYSMGANVLLKWLGETQSTALSTAIAVSVPFDLRITSNQLRERFEGFYQWWLISDLHEAVRRKYQNRKPPFDFGDVSELKSFWEFDNAITAPLNGFKDATEYYEKNSCRQFLKRIQTPTLILHSRDDPFSPPEALPNESHLSDHLILELSDYGGHIGFISGNLFLFRLTFWLEDRIFNHLKTYWNCHE